MKRKLAPLHPGEVLREEYINERGLTITEVAKGIGVARGNLSAIVNERAGISPELAVKLSEAFGNTAQFWINLQKNYELWNAEKRVNRSEIKHFWLDGESTDVSGLSVSA
ncbi:HigA family addiction module antitoxin [Persicitalea sp.]|uniref:HigA family addiction module antitoxin n=1 Tax=Persicitalea sp. TaxID=3100273 RepID=UPI003593C2EC